MWIPVATTDRNYTLKQQEYEQFTRDMGHLPTMSREYIFGQKIAQPKTDQFGHIHLSDVDQPYPVTASGAVANGDPPRPAARSKKKALTETQPKRAAVRKGNPCRRQAGPRRAAGENRKANSAQSSTPGQPAGRVRDRVHVFRDRRSRTARTSHSRLRRQLHGRPGTAAGNGFSGAAGGLAAGPWHSVRVINGGVSGETTQAGLARLDGALAARPDIVILELGANDALRGVDPAVTRRNLDAMITKIGANGTKLLLTGMLAPTNWGEEYRRAFDRVYPTLAAARQVWLYPFFLEGVALDPQLNLPDTLHPNQRGVHAIVDRIGPVVTRLFLSEGTAQKP